MESFRFGEIIRALLHDLSCCRSDNVNIEQADGFLWRLEVAHRELVAMDAFAVLELPCGPGVGVLRCVSEAHRRMAAAVDQLQVHCSETQPACTCLAAITLTGAVGRPRFEVPRHLIEFLLQTGFSVPQISHLIGVSISTVQRRMTCYGLSVQSTYSSFSDDQLDMVISDIQAQFPTAGNRQMYGLLLSRGIRVQYHRVIEAQRRVDPEGSFMRRLHCLYRRRYSVTGLQYLWHIDGNHKLIR